MGIHSNSAIVYAQLISNGKNYGVHPFFVELRDRMTHKRLPGITSGDIGSKIGYNSKENGWMAFNNVRIPRDNMLMKFAKLDREGNFSVEGDLRVLYSIMLVTRVGILYACGYYLSRALTIATRYACVRRQFATIPGQKGIERRIIDYQTQQFKLTIPLAISYAFVLAS